ncbi:unnamed protein product [Diatraea saccharalis]|uniref:Single domain major allergen protein n=1 Tax=Diatraea saccharalis TaxID=40085 RepID=A0A9N9WE29_9NEOP|nr:unnamed protein product [Diatraea saccharalis]
MFGVTKKKPLLEVTGDQVNMKFLVVVLALTSVVLTAPQPKKIFHENYEDFLDLIEERVGDQISVLMTQYIQNQEFVDTLTYLSSVDFKNLVYEMEDLPEFRAVLNYLETHSIDIMFFIDYFNEILENPEARMRTSRQEPSGQDFNSFLRDVIALFPKAELAALYDQKMADDEDFRAAMEGLNSEEWDQVFEALWDSEIFQAEVKALAENGVDIEVLLDQLVAIFGQDFE